MARKKKTKSKKKNTSIKRANKIRRRHLYDEIDGKLVYNRSRAAKEQWANARYDEFGKRVPKDYKGRVYKKNEDGSFSLVRKSQALDYAKKTVVQSDGEDRQNELNKKYLEAILHKQYTGNATTTKFHDDTTPLNVKPELEDGTPIENSDKFVFSYNVQHRFGLSEKQQENIYNLFKQANEIITMAKILHPEIGALFGTNLEYKRSIEQILRQVKAAENIVGAKDTLTDTPLLPLITDEQKQDFLSNAVNRMYADETEKRKRDLIDAFSDFIDDDKKIENLINILNTLSPSDVLYLLRRYGKESLAYSLDSIVRAFDIEQVLYEAEFLTERAKELMTKRINEFEKNKS